MKPIFAIALLAVRSALRSRLVLSLVVLILFVAVGLPLAIKGDGTLRGYATILLHYTLGLVTVILALSTTWAGCASMAAEISDHRMEAVLSKPVSRSCVWLGKWLGIVLVDACLLFLAGAMVYSVLRWNTRAATLREGDGRVLRDEVLGVRSVVPLWTAASDRIVCERAEELRKSGQIPGDMPPKAAYAAVRARLLAEELIVSPGQAKRWTVRVPGGGGSDPLIVLQSRFATSHEEDEGPSAAVRGIWTVGPPDSTNRYVHECRTVPRQIQRFSVPARCVGADGLLTVEYANAEQQAPVTVRFFEERGLEVQVSQGRLEANLARALIVVLAYLAFLTAVGVTAGSLLSLPVAAFVSLFALIVLGLGSYVHSVAVTGVFYVPHHGIAPPPTVLDAVILAMFRCINILVAPLIRFSPLEYLSQGLLVSWGDAARSVLVLVAGGGGSLFLLGTWLFRRREVAVPADY